MLLCLLNLVGGICCSCCWVYLHVFLLFSFYCRYYYSLDCLFVCFFYCSNFLPRFFSPHVYLSVCLSLTPSFLLTLLHLPPTSYPLSFYLHAHTHTSINTQYFFSTGVISDVQRLGNYYSFIIRWPDLVKNTLPLVQ